MIPSTSPPRSYQRSLKRCVLLTLGTLLTSPLIAQTPPDVSRAGNEKVAEIMRTFGGRGVMADDSLPTPAAEAVSQFRMLDGFEMQLVAAEPTVTQPLFVSWDSARTSVGRPLPPVSVPGRIEGDPLRSTPAGYL